jgi:hypothetical protein
MRYAHTVWLAAAMALGLSAACGADQQAGSGPAAPFAHPGLLHTAPDLQRMRERVRAGDEPWKSGFTALRDDRHSTSDWKLRGPRQTVTRSRQSSAGNAEMVSDGNAAYQNALMWCVTGEDAHARKAIEILNAWSSTLTAMDGLDAPLSAGLNGFKFLNAAELMRHASSAWQPADIARFERLVRGPILAPLKEFAPYANGNWDGACIKTLLAAGVFCDDPALFERAVRYYRSGSGNGRLTHYVINETGQCQESGRDQQHTQLGLGLLAEACEIAWSQGVDLYGDSDNRLLKGFEYTARYNLGDNGVPFVPHTDTTGKYRHTRISEEGRGRLRPVYEMVWNHYQRRRGIPAPFTRQAADRLRPEGGAHGSDHPGFGTLLFSLPEPGAAPK